MMTLLLTVLLCLTAAAFSAQIDADLLESSIQQLKTYHYGQDGVDLRKIEMQVAMASKEPALRGKVEQMLIDTLIEAETKEDDLTFLNYDAKHFLCKQLRTIGTRKCVPQLESMLTDPELSHMARYALGGIEDAEAGAALHRAIGKTSGAIKVGIINTIVDSNYEPALADIVRLVSDRDESVATASVKALGHFGGSASAETLSNARAGADEAMKLEIDASLLKCAEKFAAAGKKDPAREIYDEYYSEKYPEHLRIAGLKGLVVADGDKTLGLLVDAIKSSDLGLQKNAITMMAELKGSKITDTFIRLFESLGPECQELVILAFNSRGDSAATPEIIKAASSEHENVRVAALIALGSVGTEHGIAPLAKAASAGSRDEMDVAKVSLIRMKGEGMDEAFVRAINTGDDKSRVEVIRAISTRGTRKALPSLFKTAGTDKQPRIRREAILSIGKIGKESEIEGLISLAISPYDPGDRPSVEKAIATIFDKMDDRDAQARPLIAAVKTAEDEAIPLFLTLLKIPATPEAIETVRTAARSRNNSIRDAAIRSMLDWPNTDPVEDIYQIGVTSENQVYRVLACRSYVRLTRISEEPTPMYAKAMKIAKRSDEIKLVLGALASDDAIESYNLACQYLDKEEFRYDAYLAAVQVMSRYCLREPEKGKIELQKIVENAPNDDIRNRARQAIEKLR
jgi:HEAT repeat protein